MEGKLLGSTLIRRLLRLLMWGESQMDREEPPRATPSGLVPMILHQGKLNSELAYDDATGVTVTIWRGKPAVETTDTIDKVIVSLVFKLYLRKYLVIPVSLYSFRVPPKKQLL